MPGREVNINIVNTTIEETQQSYCVYEVWKDTKVIYVGVTQLINVMRLNDAKRIAEFLRMLADTDTISIAIKYVSDRIDCHRRRDMMMRSMPYMPHCNNPRNLGRMAKIQCNEDGMIFDTQAEAAEYYGFTQSSMSSHLIGRMGYRTLRGKTFCKVAG